MITIAFTAAALIATSLAQNATNNGNCTTVYDCLPILANNDDYTPSNRTRLIGGQNFTWCCTKAVIDSLRIDANGRLAVVVDPPALNLNATLLKEATDLGLFPCSADYDSSYPNGSPDINVNYTWLTATCPGWQLNRSQDLNVLQTISGFLLPAVIFCLSVPRRRKFHVFRKFFVADLAGIKSYVPAFFGAIGAMAIVTLDTVLWLSVCFALAGPMILSGLYEALLDSRVIEFVRDKVENGRLTLDMRCRLLMVVLIGNLDLDIDIDNDPFVNSISEQIPATTDNPEKTVSDGQETPTPSGVDRQTPDPQSNNSIAMTTLNDEGETVGEIRHFSASHQTNSLGIQSGDDDSNHPTFDTSIQRPPSSGLPQIHIEGASVVDLGPFQRRDTSLLKASPWRHMEELLYPIRLYDDERSDRQFSPRQYPIQREGPYPRSKEINAEISKMQTRLKTMLNCQYSFGSMVGAPVLFFLGGFVFALLQSLQDLGDEDTALALAFGQWYMTIPHIAIISGLLLAGNNPNILEGVLATHDRKVEEPKRILMLEFGLAYPSCYKVAWQWYRGPNKKRWIETLIGTYDPRGTISSPGEYYESIQQDMEKLRDKTSPGSLDWFLVLSMCGLLLGVPFILAFLTAFYTPVIGVSCRSFTFVIYTGAQFGQVLLWLWAYAGNPKPTESKSNEQSNASHIPTPSFFSRDGWLDKHGFYDPQSAKRYLVFKMSGNPNEEKMWRNRTGGEVLFRCLWCCIWYFLYIFLGCIAALAAIGGTLMQILGVYSADICNITIDKWMSPFQPDAIALISKNSKYMIKDAQRFWKPCAIAAIAFMSFVSFVGWWYQRRTRDVFMSLVSEIDANKRGDTRKAESTHIDSVGNSPSLRSS